MTKSEALELINDVITDCTAYAPARGSTRLNEMWQAFDTVSEIVKNSIWKDGDTRVIGSRAIKIEGGHLRIKHYPSTGKFNAVLMKGEFVNCDGYQMLQGKKDLSSFEIRIKKASLEENTINY